MRCTSATRPGDNVIVLDWNALAQQCPGECFAADGVHLTQTGSEYFTERIAADDQNLDTMSDETTR